MNLPLYPDAPILLVDDEESWLHSLSFTLEYSGGMNNLVTCADSREVLPIMAGREIALVLLDLTMPQVGGEELLAEITERHPQVPVVVLSGMNQVETAVRCIKSGAFDYHVKTVEPERLLAGIERALSYRALQQENRELKARVLGDDLQNPEAFAEIVYRSSRMHDVCRYLEAVAASSEPILITGESGTGKELLAKAAHALGRPGKPWFALSLAGIEDDAFPDTLFGHVRGAFTGAGQARAGLLEQAAGGTLFLDEIGDLGLPSQLKLLRLLQEGEYYPLGSDRPKKSTARLVFSTQHDLSSRLAAGTFRRDLYFRLSAHQVQVPPLRQRTEDIAPLLEHFLAAAARAFCKKAPTPPDELTLLLATYDFPGNVRELRAMVYNAVGLHQARKLSMESFKAAIDQGLRRPAAEVAVSPEQLLVFPGRLPTLQEADRLLVSEALRRSQGNQTLAARLLGLTQSGLSKRLKREQ